MLSSSAFLEIVSVYQVISNHKHWLAEYSEIYLKKSCWDAGKFVRSLLQRMVSIEVSICGA